MVESDSLVDGERDLGAIERVLQLVQVRPRLEKDGEVLVLSGHELGRAIILLHPDLLLLVDDDRADPLGHCGELTRWVVLFLLVPFVFLVIIPVDRRQEELHGALGRLLFPLVLGCLAVLGLESLAQPLLKELREHQVHERDDVLERAEVP